MLFKDDLEFIDWYLDKHYIFSGGKVYHKFNVNQTPLFKYEIVEMFCNVIPSNKDVVDKYVRDKIESNIKKNKEDIINFLNYNYKVKLGHRSWDIVNLRGKIITIDNIVQSYKYEINKGYVKKIISQWFEDEMINQTEKIIIDF